MVMFYGNFTEESITVPNSAPSITSVSISPNTSIYNDSMLTCTATVTDPDGETLTPTYEWTAGTNSLGTTTTLA